MKYRFASICASLCLFIATPAFCKEGVVKTTDGNTFAGDITEEGGKVIIKVKGIITTLERAEIASVEYASNVDEEFQKSLAKLEAEDVPGRIELARWAFEKKRYDLSRNALNDALRIDPNSREATDLLTVVSQQTAMESKKTPAPDNTEKPTEAPPETASTKPTGNARTPLAPGSRRLVSNEQINLIRQAELRSSDTNVRIRFDDDVLRTYASSAGIPIVEFRKVKMLDQALQILEKGDADLHPKVRILTDPGSLKIFRTDVQPYVVNGCATSACHGGNSPGALVLTNPGDSDAATYTNFYVLSTYAKAIAQEENVTFSAVRNMINRSNAEASLLASYSLSPEHTDAPHPRVGNFRGLFKDKADPRYRGLITWISKSLRGTDGRFDFEFSPVATPGDSSTQPSDGEKPPEK